MIRKVWKKGMNAKVGTCCAERRQTGFLPALDGLSRASGSHSLLGSHSLFLHDYDV